jgi:hypothetical protein
MTRVRRTPRLAGTLQLNLVLAKLFASFGVVVFVLFALHNLIAGGML